jgi:hypothetical protein
MMNPLVVRTAKIWFITLTVFCLWSWGTPANAQSTIWEVLPFPDSDWGGSHGQPATTNGGIVTLNGRPVRTVQSFSGPLKITYDLFLPARTTDDGLFSLLFVPSTLASNLTSPNIKLSMEYRNFGSDDLLVNQNDSGILWTTPFNVMTQTVYHCAIELSVAGNLTWAINNLTNSIPSSITVPYSSYKLELVGWQPGTIWQVSNFAAIPEPSTAILVTMGIGWLVAVRRRKNAGNDTGR